MPYQKAPPPLFPDPPAQTEQTITVDRPSGHTVAISLPKPQPTKEAKRSTTLRLDDQLVARVQAFADHTGLPSINEAIRMLLNMALSADPVHTAVAMIRQKVAWQEQQMCLQAQYDFFGQYRQLLEIRMKEAALYSGQNPIHIPDGEEPPKF